MFFQWVNATAAEDTKLATFYSDRFRSEFRPAFDAWQATDPLTSAAAPPTPFGMDEYDLVAREEAERLDAQAEATSGIVRVDLQRAANYVLAVVLFAIALFFAGISTRLRGRGARIVLVGVGFVMFLGAAVWIATFPVSVSV